MIYFDTCCGILYAQFSRELLLWCDAFICLFVCLFIVPLPIHCFFIRKPHMHTLQFMCGFKFQTKFIDFRYLYIIVCCWTCLVWMFSANAFFLIRWIQLTFFLRIMVLLSNLNKFFVSRQRIFRYKMFFFFFCYLSIFFNSGGEFEKLIEGKL